MATFTMRLKDVIDATEGKIGLDEYPIFDEAYREPLNKKIIDHYWNQEIGLETIDMFQLAVRRRMNEIMPYYNQLYKSELLEIDPLRTFDTETTSDSTAETEQSSTSESEASNISNSSGQSRTVASETPQTRLAGDEDYATGAQDAASTSQATGSANDSSTGSQEGTQHTQGTSRTSGFQGSQAELLMRYRDTFLNVDLMVIRDLADCFMQIWSTGEEYSTGHYPYGMFGYYGLW